MALVEKLIASMRRSQNNVHFVDLVKVCTHHFGRPRMRGSHYYYSVPWSGDPLVNLQNFDGKAKPYQVRAVLKAIEKLEGETDV